MIVVDASALVAIGLDEPDSEAFLQAITTSNATVLSAINYVETGIVLVRHGIFAARDHLDEWLRAFAVEVIDPSGSGPAALAAYLRFGRGFHPARLNLADCFAYALAKQLDAPLLYKGDDFAKTDVRSAL
ncbi:MAG: twitching motility protein PilT [Phenylobacterium sp.]|nr:twitching motility protein PilT [Phenylobacterium sp.]